jgi:hypothetical protein
MRAQSLIAIRQNAGLALAMAWAGIVRIPAHYSEGSPKTRMEAVPIPNSFPVKIWRGPEMALPGGLCQGSQSPVVIVFRVPDGRILFEQFEEFL